MRLDWPAHSCVIFEPTSNARIPVDSFARSMPRSAPKPLKRTPEVKCCDGVHAHVELHHGGVELLRACFTRTARMAAARAFLDLISNILRRGSVFKRKGSAFIVNGPTAGSTTGARTITKGTQVGTYTVNCDGTGVITRTVTLATGQIETFVDDFVTTAAVRSWGDVLIATTISDVAENPTTAGAAPAGLYQTRVQTRLPNQ